VWHLCSLDGRCNIYIVISQKILWCIYVIVKRFYSNRATSGRTEVIFTLNRWHGKKFDNFYTALWVSMSYKAIVLTIPKACTRWCLNLKGLSHERGWGVRET
jgi:hypothetical protein